MSPNPIASGHFKCKCCSVYFDSQIASNESCPNCFALGPFVKTKEGINENGGQKDVGYIGCLVITVMLIGLLLTILFANPWMVGAGSKNKEPAKHVGENVGSNPSGKRIAEPTSSTETPQKKQVENKKEDDGKNTPSNDIKDRELSRLHLRIDDMQKQMSGLSNQLRSKEKLLQDAIILLEHEKSSNRILLNKASDLEAGLTRAKLENNRLANSAREPAVLAPGMLDIDLSAKRVVLIMDASGSMEFVNEFERSAKKRKEAQRLAGNLLESIPALEFYQVVVMGASSFWLEGQSGWIRHQKGKTGARVTENLATVELKGGTDMHKAMDLAFSLRKDGLDMILVIADGAPTMGEGLNDRQKESLSAEAKNIIIGQNLIEKTRKVWNNPTTYPQVVRINTIGLFYEGTEHGALLWAMAHENYGRFVGLEKP